MKKWSMPVKISAFLVALAIGLGGYFVHQAGYFQKEIIEETAVYIQLHSDDPEEVQRGRERVAAYDRAMEEIFDRHPELRPKWKKVAPEKNGYLKLTQLAESCEIGNRSQESIFDIPDEVRDAFFGEKNWDDEVVREYLLKVVELINEIRVIGIMTEQSMVGVNMDYLLLSKFYSEFVGRGISLLCLDACFAAKEGGDKKAIESLLAANGIVEHICQIETPCLISETVGMMLQRQIFRTAINDVVLTEDGFSDLRKKLRPGTNKDLGRVFMGDFYVGTRASIMSFVQPSGGKSAAYDIPDLQTLYDEYAERCKHDVKVLSRVSMRGRFSMKRSLFPYKSKYKLSRQAKEFTLDEGESSLPVFGGGHARSLIMYRYYDAILAIAAGEEPPVELLTGKPFIFDSLTRELKFPADPLLDFEFIHFEVVPQGRLNE